MKRGLTKALFSDILITVWAKIHGENVKKKHYFTLLSE